MQLKSEDLFLYLAIVRTFFSLKNTIYKKCAMTNLRVVLNSLINDNWFYWKNVVKEI